MAPRMSSASSSLPCSSVRRRSPSVRECAGRDAGVRGVAGGEKARSKTPPPPKHCPQYHAMNYNDPSGPVQTPDHIWHVFPINGNWGHCTPGCISDGVRDYCYI